MQVIGLPSGERDRAKKPHFSHSNTIRERIDDRSKTIKQRNALGIDHSNLLQS